MYTLLELVIGMGMISALMEMRGGDNVKAALFRSYCFILQGCWIIQIGFALHSPWKWEKEQDFSRAMVVFVGHMLLASFGILGINCLVAFFQAPKSAAEDDLVRLCIAEAFSISITVITGHFLVIFSTFQIEIPDQVKVIDRDYVVEYSLPTSELLPASC